MDIICNKIRDKVNLDSEIIQEMESAKNKPGFNINWIDNVNHSLLMYAVLRRREELVRYLLTYSNININYETYWYHRTALHFCKDVFILRLLLNRKNLNVNIQSREGWTGLYFTCWNNRIEWVKELLLDARANLSIRDDQGRTTRDHAISWGYHGIANVLKRTECTSLLRILNASLCRDIARMIIEEYV